MNKYNRKIIDTRHFIDRAIEQYQGVSLERIQKVINDGINSIVENYQDESTTYGIWSRSTGICVIIDWRKEGNNKRDGKNHAIIITLPPPKKEFTNFHTTGKNDVRIIVEKVLDKMIPFYIKKGKIREVKLNNHSIFFEKGKMFDSGIAYCIEVK